MRAPSRPRFFASPPDLRRWFDDHVTATELWIGFYKKGSGKPSVTWPESVDEALRVGWIDGIRKRLDEERYVIRFTPRQAGSVWSAVNIRRVRELEKLGQMREPGLKAFAARRENRSGIYSYEQRPATLVEPYASLLRKNKAAWALFQAQPPSHQRTLTWWVISAKKEETRLARLRQLVDHMKPRPASSRTPAKPARKKR